MFFQFLSDNIKPVSKRAVRFSKNLILTQYINNGYMMNVYIKSDKILETNHIEKLISRQAIEIENITFSRTTFSRT